MTEHIFMAEVVQPALVKDGALFMVCRADGGITKACGSGLGIFYRDTRYLSAYEIRIGAKPPLTLMTSSARGDQAVLELTNDAVEQLDDRPLEVQSLGVHLERTADGERLTLTDVFTLRNFAPESVTFRLSLTIDALFEDIFELRGAKAVKRGPPRAVKGGENGLGFDYLGADGVARRMEVGFSRPARVRGRGGARVADFDFSLESQARESLTITFAVDEAGAPRAASPPKPAFYHGVGVESDYAVLNLVAERSIRDLAMLRTGLADNFIAGGMPWFVSPFGRDSILAARHTLAFDPRPAEGVARLFAVYQGKKRHAETGEQPGKIHHELRLGAMAHLKEVPHRPSYTSVDSTPLYLILIGEHARWTGCLDLFRELRPAVDAALAWLDGDGDSDRDGYLDYTGDTPEGPINQGWKDSSFGIPRKDGGLPKSPIALCEVQGYVYLAKTLIAAALRSNGEGAGADRLEAQAKKLRERFNRDFWMEDEGCYALALERGGRQVTVVSSNAGQALWSGIAEADKAARTAERLMAPDMNCGWGVRTLSEGAAAYNPLNYHLGCVWPFDNALIVAGLRRYGLDEAALRLFAAVVDAGGYFALGRLPEFYVGFTREPGLFPARCPFAEPMQAWSAGAVPYMLASLLGLTRVGEEVRMERPVLPLGVDRLAVRGLSSGNARIDCELGRGADGVVHGRVTTARETDR
ncbi:MAG: amylo-alpha-1,6-glucosidase [Caulobacteraceae bacterium]